jgi:hypothetical protein
MRTGAVMKDGRAVSPSGNSGWGRSKPRLVHGQNCGRGGIRHDCSAVAAELAVDAPLAG